MRRTEPKDELNIFREGVVRMQMRFVNIPVRMSFKRSPGKS